MKRTISPLETRTQLPNERRETNFLLESKGTTSPVEIRDTAFPRRTRDTTSVLSFLKIDTQAWSLDRCCASYLPTLSWQKFPYLRQSSPNLLIGNSSFLLNKAGLLPSQWWRRSSSSAHPPADTSVEVEEEAKRKVIQ